MRAYRLLLDNINISLLYKKILERKQIKTGSCVYTEKQGVKNGRQHLFNGLSVRRRSSGCRASFYERVGAAGGRGAPVGAERAEKASPCIPAAWGGAANHALIICIEHGSIGAGIAGRPRGLDCGSARPRARSFLSPHPRLTFTATSPLPRDNKVGERQKYKAYRNR